jgi:hypothetical protein
LALERCKGVKIVCTYLESGTESLVSKLEIFLSFPKYHLEN